MKHLYRLSLFTLILIVSSLVVYGVRSASAQAASDNIVRAVLFFSPTCPHCEKVITEDLPPLMQQYGDRLQILGIDISQPKGLQLYQATVKAMSIPNNRLGVPTLIVADQVLVGSAEIPALLPGLVEQYLAQGGVDWPAIPGLPELLAQVTPTSAETPAVTDTPTPEASLTPQPTVIPTQPPPTPTATEVPPYLLSFESSQQFLTSFKNDQPANSIASVVLAGMILSAVVMPFAIARPLIVPWQRLDCLVYPAPIASRPSHRSVHVLCRSEAGLSGLLADR